MKAFIHRIFAGAALVLAALGSVTAQQVKEHSAAWKMEVVKIFQNHVPAGYVPSEAKKKELEGFFTGSGNFFRDYARKAPANVPSVKVKRFENNAFTEPKPVFRPTDHVLYVNIGKFIGEDKGEYVPVYTFNPKNNNVFNPPLVVSVDANGDGREDGLAKLVDGKLQHELTPVGEEVEVPLTEEPGEIKFFTGDDGKRYSLVNVNGVSTLVPVMDAGTPDASTKNGGATDTGNTGGKQKASRMEKFEVETEGDQGLLAKKEEGRGGGIPDNAFNIDGVWYYTEEGSKTLKLLPKPAHKEELKRNEAWIDAGGDIARDERILQKAEIRNGYDEDGNPTASTLAKFRNDGYDWGWGGSWGMTLGWWPMGSCNPMFGGGEQVYIAGNVTYRNGNPTNYRLNPGGNWNNGKPSF